MIDGWRTKQITIKSNLDLSRTERCDDENDDDDESNDFFLTKEK